VSDPVDPDVVERARQTTYVRAEAAWERAGEHDELGRPHQVYQALRLAAVEAERIKLLELRARGAYPSRIFREAQALLDLEETRLRPRASGH
jgi:CPA1 family monovalent cation:H+ antiporter